MLTANVSAFVKWKIELYQPVTNALLKTKLKISTNVE
jgi:hypothetical protein